MVGRAWHAGRVLWPGVALSAVLAMAATLVSTLHGGPQLLYALLFGVAFHYLSHDPATKPGIDFCGRAVLRWGVGLLGARITAAQIVGLGWETALTIGAALVTTMLCGSVVGRELFLTRSATNSTTPPRPARRSAPGSGQRRRPST